jgi:hypothetical protein
VTPNRICSESSGGEHCDMARDFLFGKVAKIHRDDSAGATDDRGGHDVLVVGIGEAKCAFVGFQPRTSTSSNADLICWIRCSERLSATSGSSPSFTSFHVSQYSSSSRIALDHSGRYMPSIAKERRKSRCKLGHRTRALTHVRRRYAHHTQVLTGNAVGVARRADRLVVTAGNGG